MGNGDKIHNIKGLAVRLERTEWAVRALIKKGKLRRLAGTDSRVYVTETECVRFLRGEPVRMITSALRA